ncbi:MULTISPECIES: hypothetical protein [Sorangium]|uniref:Peptidase A1 domain-containing protein n=1 Tax=Sorangium cellulosum TaxID=56 RepID=A0A4P2QNT0_SORCE|nr:MULTISPECIES: hypothetical protein [Sorangium]AUX31777.1 uncharacterized protein SOCE836_039090 [Sorangium cellulosum]WCQ91155.1 hypothetical protein NQZ70_03870 [Sorangium sp. Soce836]
MSEAPPSADAGDAGGAGAGAGGTGGAGAGAGGAGGAGAGAGAGGVGAGGAGAGGAGGAPLADLQGCHGEKRPLVVSRQMPYAVARVGAAEGHFLLDFGTTASTIDPQGFAGGVAPAPVAGSADRFADFDFYGPWGTVRLTVQDHSGVQGTVRQAGILGTDFLSLNAFTLDYEDGAVYRADAGALCADEILRAEGMKPLWTAGYYSSDLAAVQPGFPNVPTVPARIGAAQAVAQLDTGYDDAVYRRSVNINRAFFAAIEAAGIDLDPVPEAAMSLSTCVPGQSEQVSAYRVLRGAPFELVSTDGSAAVAAQDVMLFLKDTPPEARQCGGIGTWSIPAAQVAASFYVDARRLVFDPVTSRVWMGAPR